MMSVLCRYRLRIDLAMSKNLEESFATRDMGVASCLALSRRLLAQTVYLVDYGAPPPSLVGCATKGHWRGVAGTCKTCKGTGTTGPGISCTGCAGFGVQVEPEPWRAI
jgi:hypothetical protein